MHTTAFWLHFPMEFLLSLPYSTVATRDGMIGLGNVLRTVGGVMLMCDTRDLGVSALNVSGGPEALLDPELFLYDNFPGGTGQSEPLFRMRHRLGESARDLLAGCPCKTGCPSCVGAPGEVGEQAKAVAVLLAESLAERQSAAAA